MNILIIEDERAIANRLLRMTNNYFGVEVTAIHHCDSVVDGLEFIDSHKIDLLFLDLNLNGEDGFEVLQNMVSQSFHTIIVSAYKEKAIQAFEYGVLDFVPKPFNEKRLYQALDRINNVVPSGAQSNIIKYLSILKKGSQHLIELEQVHFIKGARVYTEIYLKNGTKEIHNKSLDALMQLLPSNFERIHKSFIVDMHAVSKFNAESGGKYSALLNSGDQLPISRSKYKDLKAKYLI